MADPSRFPFMIEDLFDVIEPTQRIEVIKQRPRPAKGQIDSITFTFILRFRNPLCDVFEIRCFFAVGGINFVGRVETSRKNRVRAIRQRMGRHRTITSVHFNAIRHPPTMDLQIAIIRR